jgi:uncharacterized repeat protein (TIGR02543 family)
MPAEPTRSGLAFGGWYTERNGGGTQFTATTTVTGNITLYAAWIDIPIPDTSLEGSLSWLVSNAVDGGSYSITLQSNEAIAPKTLSYSGKMVRITLKGDSLAEQLV